MSNDLAYVGIDMAYILTIHLSRGAYLDKCQQMLLTCTHKSRVLLARLSGKDGHEMRLASCQGLYAPHAHTSPRKEIK
jgi:hypothetical protein